MNCTGRGKENKKLTPKKKALQKKRTKGEHFKSQKQNTTSQCVKS